MYSLTKYLKVFNVKVRQDVLQKDKMGMKYVGHAENTVPSPEITKNPKVQWSRWQEYNCDCYVWLLFITSGVFLPTTDELCNLARGVDTRNVQLDPRTKNCSDATIKGCSVLTSALLTLCLSPKCFSAASVVCSKSCFVPIHAHIWFPSESASQPVVIFCETNFIGSMWRGVAVEQLETQLTVTDLRRRIRNQSFNRIYIDQGVVECMSPILYNGMEIDWSNPCRE